ncbi:CENPO [Branchiostoma lanceolatum]|uniref:Centromere protein O n=1 Tax=Branchiostoma lanceolatum TaxID=7740 RepID=A0A8K0EDL2_BRALA|nr:CENPO [Branchiostoma lanceolatum]
MRPEKGGMLEFLQQLDAKATKLTSYHGNDSPQGHPGEGQGQRQEVEGQRTSDDDAATEMETIIQNLQEKKKQLKQKLCTGPKQVFGSLENKKLRRFKVKTEADRACVRRATDYIKQRKTEELKKAYSFAGISMARVSESCVSVTWGTFYSGQYRETYQAHINVSDSLKINQHTLPIFLPLEELSSAHLNSDLKRFLWAVGDHLNAYVSRREQLAQAKTAHPDLLQTEVEASAGFDLLKLTLTAQRQQFNTTLVYKGGLNTRPTTVEIQADDLSTEETTSKIQEAFLTKSLPEALTDIATYLNSSL